MHFSGGMASCTACMIAPLPYVVDEGFGHDGAAGVSWCRGPGPWLVLAWHGTIDEDWIERQVPIPPFDVWPRPHCLKAGIS